MSCVSALSLGLAYPPRLKRPRPSLAGVFSRAHSVFCASLLAGCQPSRKAETSRLKARGRYSALVSAYKVVLMPARVHMAVTDWQMAWSFT
ncbi:hypothetical protein D3C72_1566540 [compost metagenome]